MAITTEQVLEVTKLALDFAKTAIDAGKDPVAETRKRLVDVNPLVEAADDDVADALDRKFGKK